MTPTIQRSPTAICRCSQPALDRAPTVTLSRRRGESSSARTSSSDTCPFALLGIAPFTQLDHTVSMAKSRRGFLKTAGMLAAIPCEAEYSPEPPTPADTAEPAGKIPKVPLGKYEISRLIIGANPFYGYSHFNQLFSRHMVEWATPEHVIDTLRESERQGINTWQCSPTAPTIAATNRYPAERAKIQSLLLTPP